MKKIVDVSGYGNSGKSAVIQFLKGFNDIYSFPEEVEFELLRVPNGLLDLYVSNYYNWNLIRSDYKLKKFLKITERIGGIQNLNNPISYLKYSGHNYNKYFNNKFVDISQKYVQNIIELKQYMYWPYDNINNSKFEMLISKLSSKIKKNLLVTEVNYSYRDKFKEYSSNYIHELFDNLPSSKNFVLLNNAFEPYNTSTCVDLIKNSCSIIVDRDPRDIYANLINIEESFKPEFESYKHSDTLKKQITAFNDIDVFIKRYKILKQNVQINNEENILRISFEDFILNHKNTSDKILNFIDLNSHKKNSYNVFDSNKSKQNIGIWKKYKNSIEIKKIENELSEYCFDF